MSSSTTKRIIRIDENGPRVESNGNVIASDLKLTLKDFIPEITNWSTWNGTLQKGDTVDITTAYKFIAVRSRNNTQIDNSTISTTPNLISACLPANNSLSSTCGCNADSEDSSSEVLLNFEMNQYTNYSLSESVIYSDNDIVLDFSRGATAIGVTGWSGCTCTDCGTTGATGTGNNASIGVTGLDVPAKGVYSYKFSSVLRNGKFVIKTTSADSLYKCDLDYYTFGKNSDDTIAIVFNDTAGKWVIVRLTETLTQVLNGSDTYQIIEMVEWSETNWTYKNSNITLPLEISSLGSTGTNSYSGTVTELDNNMPVTFKMNSLFIMECDSFKGTITSQLNNLDVNIMLAF